MISYLLLDDESEGPDYDPKSPGDGVVGAESCNDNIRRFFP